MAALPIRQRLSALTCLKPGAKAVLMEVCELHENGGRGCFISNGTLSKKLGVSLATVTRTIASLAAWGLLAAHVVPAEANRRYLVPAAAVRACYAGGTEAQQLAAVLELTIVKSESASVLTIVNPGTDYSQNGELTIVKNGADYSQNASRVIGDEQDDQLDEQDDQREALALASKKNKELAAALAEANASLATCRTTIATLRAELDASHTRGRATGVATPIASTLPYASAEFAESWQSFRAANGIAPNSARERELFKSLAEMASTEIAAIATVNKAIRKGWKDLYKLDEPRPVNLPAPGQPERGAKPTANAITGARALSQYLRSVNGEAGAAAGGAIVGGTPAGAYGGQG
jgi:DNA-binding MarR family transcriptional regulator